VQLVGEPKNSAPEIQLLVACARKTLAAVDVECIESLVPAGVNWPNLVADALHHDCAGRLDAHLSAVVAGRIPLQWREVLRRSAQQARAADQLSIDEVERISRLLSADGIAFVPSQVPILGWLASRGLRHNEYADLEFLIRERDVAQVGAILQSAGYLPRADRETTAGGPYQFIDENAGVFFALQTERTLRGVPVESTIDRAAGGTMEVEISGRRLRATSLEDLLVHLCVWGATGYWNRLRAIGNVGEVIEASGLDWNSAIRIAQQLQCGRLLLLGVYVAHRVLRADVSAEILARAEADTRVRRLAEPIIEQFTPIAASTQRGRGARSRAYFRLASRDTAWQGIRHTLRLSASPTEIDREVMPAPGKFSPAYAILRPWRLWREHGMRDRPGPDLAGFQPTPEPVVDRLLQLAKVGTRDVLYDLGCGDGRIVIRAAMQYGIRAVGVDVNPQRILEARANAQRSGVADRVEFRHEDAKTTDVRAASVVVLYLSVQGNLRLMQSLREQLRPGARIVSHGHGMASWPAHAQETAHLEDGTPVSLYLWHIESSETHEKETG